jgi:hypothetical protein
MVPGVAILETVLEFLDEWGCILGKVEEEA